MSKNYDYEEIFDGVLYESTNYEYEMLPTTENLYWHRVKKLFDMYNNIVDDLVYKAMWERKLKELLLRGLRGE